MASKALFHDIIEALTVYDIKERESIAFLLLGHHTGLSKAQILANFSVEDTMLKKILNKDIEHLNAYYPVQYLLGYIDFYGLKLKVSPAVLIPRPETEELVQTIIDDRSISPQPIILDIGTGTGCIALALKKHIPSAQIYAVDNSCEALNLAEENVRIYNLEIYLQFWDIFDLKIPKNFKLFDVIVSNPPYIPMNEKNKLLPNLDFEPDNALFVPDNDPIIFYRKIINLGSKMLKPKGWLYFEMYHKYNRDIIPILEKYHYKNISILKDINGKDRILKACR